MEILDKKSNRMSRANSGVFECNEFSDLQRILDFLSLRNLLSNELFLLFMNLQQSLFLYYKRTIDSNSPFYKLFNLTILHF